MKTIYYYQTFVGLNDLFTHLQDIDVIIVSSIHFDKSQIYLNDNKPNDKIFDELWNQTHYASDQNVTILLMIGGAGGAYQELFNDFENNYKQLKELLEEKTWIQGIDLDIEEEVKIEDVKMLMDRLIKDFGNDFILTMAPVSASLMHDFSGMGGFCYKDIYKSKQGKYIKWFNTQCYNSFSKETYDLIIKNGYPPEKIVMGMMSGQFDKTNFKTALDEVKKIVEEYPNMSGVYDWEYLNAPPDKHDPSIWCKLMKQITILNKDNI